MAKQDTGRVVVRRKRAYGEGHHGGSWKIAYADFMTAMMAFFLVMWLLLLVPKTELEGIAEYFRTPLITAVTGGPKVDSSRSVIPGGEPSVLPNDHSTPPQSPLSDMDQEDQMDQESLENLKQQLESLIEHNPVLKQFRPQLLLDMTPDGLRIQILDQQNRPMFATGSARVQPYMRDILRELAVPISQLPNSITISGHTDAMQYASGDRSYSNWELSADRANSARRELVAGGLVERKVKRILGLGETVNLIEDDPMAAVNRRISVLVLNRRAERRIDAQNAAGTTGKQVRQLLEELSHPGQTGNGSVASPNASVMPPSGVTGSGTAGLNGGAPSATVAPSAPAEAPGNAATQAGSAPPVENQSSGVPAAAPAPAASN
ncbi:MAG: flagellar motor protein MotB [Castellaniella sp.]|uniref:flagellar motor protein MotB n=1 Tax=Castellaniella sp. TaxID=1955812 RepID=UPI003C78299C